MTFLLSHYNDNEIIRMSRGRSRNGSKTRTGQAACFTLHKPRHSRVSNSLAHYHTLSCFRITAFQSRGFKIRVGRVPVVWRQRHRRELDESVRFKLVGGLFDAVLMEVVLTRKIVAVIEVHFAPEDFDLLRASIVT